MVGPPVHEPEGDCTISTYFTFCKQIDLKTAGVPWTLPARSGPQGGGRTSRFFAAGDSRTVGVVSGTQTINGELGKRVSADTAAMEWTPSPSGTVWRKRVHLVGPPESGQVTSVVRYEPGSTFHPHGHPDGEEILVLEGVFSDEHGDWPALTYLLNPEGFRHSPFSREGCVLLVKLRQFPGRTREHVALRTDTLEWQPGARAGVSVRQLYSQAGFADTMRLERWSPTAELDSVVYPHGAELFVLEGSFSDAEGEFARGAWLRLPPGTAHSPSTAEGCVVYVKEGGFAYLRAG